MIAVLGEITLRDFPKKFDCRRGSGVRP